jgi:hypothetical protein
VVRCGSKNGYKEDMCSKEIDFMLNHLSSWLKSAIIWGGVLDCFMALALLILKNHSSDMGYQNLI